MTNILIQEPEKHCLSLDGLEKVVLKHIFEPLATCDKEKKKKKKTGI